MALDRSGRSFIGFFLAWMGILMSLLLWGCGWGEKGSTGATGTAGSSGAAGTSATTPSTGNAYDTLPGVNLNITGISGASGSDGTFRAGDTISVTFTIRKDDGTNWDLTEMDSGSIYVSGPTTNYQRVIASQSDLRASSVSLGSGTYRYTFTTTIPSTYIAPYNDTTSFGSGDGELQGQALQAGTYTVGMQVYWNFSVDGTTYKDVGNETEDFLFGGATTLAPREVVKTDNCNRCHETLQMHGGSRRDVKLCVLCHTSGAEDRNVASVDGGTPGVTIDFRTMIHKIHNGAHLASVLGVATNSDGTRTYTATSTSYTLVGYGDTSHDFSSVSFPVWPNMSYAMPRDYGYSGLSSANKTLEDTMRKGVTDCEKCHGDPDGSGPLTAPAQGALHHDQPSRRACGSCHDDVNFSYPYTANLQTMPAQASDSACTQCHTSEGTALSVEDAHTHPINNSTTHPGVVFAVTSISGATGGSGAYFQAGDKPQVTFTVKDDSGTDVSLAALDSTSTLLVGPTSNRQFVFPFDGPKTPAQGLPVDFSGRLVSSSTSNKGIMSKVVGTTSGETLKVLFTSATAFTVTADASGAARGGSALSASPSTNPASSSLTAVSLSTSAVAQTITVAFTNATDFTVTGSVSGAMGSGSMPASSSASRRFTSTDGTVAFTLTSGSTAFASGNNIYVTVYQTTSNGHLFAIVAGRTSFAAGDRFYYDTVTAASSYTYAMPMNLFLEFLGDGVTGAGGETFTASNLPVYWGRETIYERTAVSNSTSLTAAASARDRYVDLNAVTGLAAGDYVVLDNGTASQEEYLKIGVISGTRVWFTTPLRYAHANGSACDEATLTLKLEGTDYTLNPITGTLTTVTAITATNAVVASYRTDGAFGWYRHGGDTRQDVYPPPMNDSNSLGQDWGEWTGLSYQNGTYTASIWGAKTLYVGVQNEVQTYNGTSVGALKDFLYGASGTVTPYALISSSGNCNACHSTLLFHGGGRRDADTCLMCHGTAGSEDWPAYAGSSPAATDGVTVNYRTMLHKIHMGEELTNASTYTVVGHSGGSHTYEEVVFPAMPNKVKHCEKCHGSGSTMWKAPATRSHTSQTTPTREWRAVCGSCHDSTSAGAHIDIQTSSGGVESCSTCHGDGKSEEVDIKHKNW
jgi:OmcA/MtrC family decaheme c-type cytochrome